jgi:hypothetical protein
MQTKQSRSSDSRSLQATACLLKKIGEVQPDKLRPFLDCVFPFVSVEALRPIVVTVSVPLLTACYDSMLPSAIGSIVLRNVLTMRLN